MRARRERRIGQARELRESITISRDRFGIPHIVGASWQDTLFGLGFATAEDRLWQMDLSRRVALGNLSQIVGREGLESDKMMRLLGMPRIAHQLARRLSDDERIACEHYAAGVNHFIDTARLPAEFRLLRYHPEPWEPADSLAVFRLLAWILSGSLDADLTAEALRATIGEEWTTAIYRGSYPAGDPVVCDHGRDYARRTTRAETLPLFPSFGGSNAWAVAATHSVTGGALLANDPHLELRNPSIWHEARLEAPGFRVTGVAPPGVPCVVIGRTPSLAWGATAAETPQVFLYRESLNEEGQFEERDGWQPLQIHDEFIAVKNEPSEMLTIRRTPRGPVVSDLLPQPDGQAVSLHWTGMEEGHELGVLLDAIRSSSLDDLLPAFDRFVTPGLQLILADSGGEIASVSVGRMATRDTAPGLLSTDTFPPTYVDPDDLPLERNPERGWVATANNRIAGDDYPHPIHGNWAPGFRYRRIVEDLESRERHSPGDFRTLQLDVYSMQAADVVPALLPCLEGVVAPWVVDELRDWDFRMTAQSRAALLFEAIHHEWTRLALEHRLPAEIANMLVESSGALSVPVLFVDRVLRGELPAWMDDDERGRIAALAGRRAIAWITERLGPDTDGWTWGSVHQLTLTHPLGLQSGPHQRRVNVGPFPVGGGNYTVSPTVWLNRDPYNVVAGASMRFVADLKRPELGWMTNTLGQSGSPFSRHFRDQVEDYLEGFVHAIWPEGFPPRGRRVIEPEY